MPAKDTVTILMFGDVFGKPGRAALCQALPDLKKQYAADVVIVNIENMAHGKGVTLNSMAELEPLGIDAYTSGNHVFDKTEAAACFERYPQLIRPANYDGVWPGSGYYRFAKDGQQFLVLNVNGQVFFEKQFRGTVGNPFLMVDQLISEQAQRDDIILVDIHAEATSEKNAFGWYVDGRVAAVVGTHTHIPTADQKILPKGTAYVTDLGMTGPRDSVLGAPVSNAIDSFLGKGPFVFEVAESPVTLIQGVCIKIKKGSAVSIERVYKEVSSIK